MKVSNTINLSLVNSGTMISTNFLMPVLTHKNHVSSAADHVDSVVKVGDRYFTDIVYGNSNGLLTIRPAPLTSIGEPFVVRRVQYFLKFQ